MKSRGILWIKAVLGFTVFQWLSAGDRRKHERQRERSGILGNRLMFVDCAQGPCVAGLHFAMVSLWTELRILSHTAFHMGMSPIWTGCLLILHPGLLSKSDFTGVLSLRAWSTSSLKLLKWPPVSPFAGAVPLSAWALCDPIKVSNMIETLN